MIEAMVSIQVAGEALVDIYNSQAHPGGSPLNVAVGLGRLGHEVELSTEVGSDEHGQLIVEHLKASGVKLSEGSVSQSPTSTATVVLDGCANASYEFELNCTMGQLALSDAQLLHTGSIAAFRSPSAAQIIELFAASPADQLRSYDPNLRPALVENRAQSIDNIEKLCSLAHVVKLSDEDAMWLYPGWDTDRVLEHLLNLGASLAVMTFGARGCEARTRHCEVAVASRSVRTVDTIGAGDAFMAGLLHAIATGDLAQNLLAGDRLDRVQLEQALELATACAGMTVARAGANPPTLEELQSFMAKTIA
ncbi:hypothetical protein AS038_12960 [Arthrobacter sp. NIO-1057]|nr:hypothetical protein AS038_12960 [Arthrobacter sp. NIO-1057]SCC43210.1 fructokinase [Arthrobacter sp. NIO-1057]